MAVRMHITMRLCVKIMIAWQAATAAMEAQNRYLRPYLSLKEGSQRRVLHHPRKKTVPSMPIFQPSTHVRSSCCYQLLRVLLEFGSASHDVIAGSAAHIFSFVHSG